LDSRFDTVEDRLRRIEDAVNRIAAVLPHLATKADLARIEAALPHLATRAELADKPGRLYLWAVMAAMTAAETTAFNAACERAKRACEEGIAACKAAIAEINAARIARGVPPHEYTGRPAPALAAIAADPRGEAQRRRRRRACL
jgi:hypothetical protein